MPRYKVTGISTICFLNTYIVDAEDEVEAEEMIINGEGEEISSIPKDGDLIIDEVKKMEGV